jgi:transcriptional regulator with XRE-family HTH domain
MEKRKHSKAYARLLRVLVDARKKAGLTQVEVADAFGAHAPFVWKSETGERRIDVVEFAEFCRLYGVKPSAILKAAGLE